MQFIVGQMARLRGEFQDGDTRDEVDPTVVTVMVRKPVPDTNPVQYVETSYVYGVDVTVIRDDVGSYYIDVNLDVVGLWFHRWKGTGNVTAADDRGFMVGESEFDTP